MIKLSLRVCLVTIAMTLLFSLTAFPQTVKITPLGSHDGEFCSRDRAMLFEDPDGTRLLFDAGQTVAGPEDPRLGKIDAVLLSGMHGDHIGDKRISKVGNGTCAEPQTEVATLPDSNTAAIIVGKKAKALLGGEMHTFMQAKMKAAGGSPRQVERQLIPLTS